MRIYFISPQVGTIGGTRSLVESIRAVLEKGHQGVVLLPRHGPVEDLFAEHGIPCFVIPYAHWLKPYHGRKERLLFLPRLINQARHIKNELAGKPPDVVYSNTMASPVGAVLAKMLRCPHVWHLREFGYDDHGLKYVFGESACLKWAGRATSCFLANSIAVARHYEPYLPQHAIEVLYQGVRLSEEGEPAPERTPGCFRCVMASMINEGKGYLDAVLALDHLQKQGKNVELLIAGAAPIPGHLNFLQEEIRKRGLVDRVRFLGRSMNVVPLMRSADAVLMCSKKEAFGRVTAEAMLAGVPVIGTRSGATPELIQDGETGWLYSPGAPDQLAERIGAMMAHPEQKRMMGKAAAAWAKEALDQEAYNRRLVASLERVVSSGK